MSNSPEPPDDVLPGWDVPPPPLAIPVAADAALPADIPLAMPVVPLAQPVTDPEIPLATPVESEPEPPPPEPIAPPLAAPAPAAPPTTITCPACATAGPIDSPYCSDCGYYFSAIDLTALVAAPAGVAAEPAPSATGSRVKDRYELVELTAERGVVQRYRARDHGASPPATVTVVRQPLPAPPAPQPPPVDDPAATDDEILPSFDEPSSGGFPKTEVIAGRPTWPGIGWERKLLATMDNPALPSEIDYFCDDTSEYLVLEVPAGRSLWDAWDDPDGDSSTRYGYLVELAESVQRLHQCNALLEGLRPDMVVMSDDGRVRLTDLGALLPLPFAPNTPVRGGLYTAPELTAGRGLVDTRADLYAFGAMMYALMLGRELNEKTDFDEAGTPKLFSRFPDLHPGFARLMLKTLRKEVEARFPTDETRRDDESGFTDLIRTLEVLRRTLDNVRLDVASWTSTGIVRTGNEDAFAVLHAGESRQDDLGEAALVLLCDGMGGYEAGEVAAALTLQSLRQTLMQMRPFSVAAGASPFPTDPLKEMSKPGGHAAPPINIEEVKKALKSALRDANKLVFQTSRAPGSKRRGMGCTAEAVYVDGRHVVVGHVGDSRTYHLHEGRLIQLTRDQTLVNRLVELGTLSAAEAETHPRRNELQQAIGGQPDVEPGLYHGLMAPGDWVVVCSDGLTNHISAKELEQMLMTEASSAEMAARRLVTLTLILGATDNVTVVAIRAT